MNQQMVEAKAQSAGETERGTGCTTPRRRTVLHRNFVLQLIQRTCDCLGRIVVRAPHHGQLQAQQDTMVLGT